MTFLQISELADRAGVPSSTLRYYERIGLVQPECRADNGYRLYDESVVERLAFIGRAKRLGMSLDDVATLVDAWFAGECEPLQDRLRAFVAGRLGKLRHQIADESAFEHQLERILDRLERAAPAPERCGPDCGCDTDPFERLVALGPASADGASSVIACSLDRGEAERRLGEWRQVVRRADRAQRIGTRLRLVFETTVPDAVALAGLCAAETECCPVLEFSLGIAARAVVLTIDGPAAMVDVFVQLSATDRP